MPFKLKNAPSTISGLSGYSQSEFNNILKSLRSVCDQKKTLAEKFEVLGVSGGFYPTENNANNMARATLFLLYATPYFPEAPGGYSNLALDMVYYGLMGFIDESLWSWYEIKFGFKTIQEALSTEKTLDYACEEFLKYAGDSASSQAISGVIAAGKTVKSDYGDLLWEKLKRFLKDAADPFKNPILGPILEAILWIGGIYVAINLVKMTKK